MHESLQSFKRTEADFIHLLCFERPDSQQCLNPKERLRLNLVSAWLLTEGEKKTNGVTVTFFIIVVAWLLLYKCMSVQCF